MACELRAWSNYRLLIVDVMVVPSGVVSEPELRAIFSGETHVAAASQIVKEVLAEHSNKGL